MQPWSPSVENDLRHLLNEWDSLGVADDMQDEYDCMLAPMLQRLHGGANETEIVSSCGTSWRSTSVSILLAYDRKRWLPK
ncbi:hypothetical protein [Streptomyces sp. NBC_00316]|uniref:hypothetical protein n=1 Tax=Streptomyces sp. NBC_00316 TaxID=2975710 RepID=UPI002E2AF77F|nr:hypothetical protein [Streptomyces sp. NBC_00316]